MADNMGQLIKDIDKLDGYRKLMMTELKHLRDITMFYVRLYPELHITYKNSTALEDAKYNTSKETREKEVSKPVPDKCPTADEKKNN